VVMKKREKTEERRRMCYPRIKIDRGVPGF
jgi:hypothetical protein